MYGSVIDNLVSIAVDKDIEDITSVHATAEIKLDLVTSGVKSQTITNLRRGNTSSLSGKAAMLYHVLAAAFDIPVFCVGRTDQCLLSFRRDEDGQRLKRKVVSDIEAMYRLANPDRDRNYYRYHFRNYEQAGHNANWMQVRITRPSTMVFQSVLNFMEIENIWAVIPRAHCNEAIVALEQGRRIALDVRRR